MPSGGYTATSLGMPRIVADERKAWPLDTPGGSPSVKRTVGSSARPAPKYGPARARRPN